MYGNLILNSSDSVIVLQGHSQANDCSLSVLALQPDLIKSTTGEPEDESLSGLSVDRRVRPVKENEQLTA